MKRRNFIKLSLAAYVSLMLPSGSSAADVDFGAVEFDGSIYDNNAAQVLVIFLYGGASQLAGNLTNIDAIKSASQSSYEDYFGDMTATTNECWEEAGGNDIEEMMAAGDMTLFRSCFSQVREDINNKSHPLCIEQNQKGTFEDDGDRGGIFANIAQVLHEKKVIDAGTTLPFVSLERESNFFKEGRAPLDSYLKVVSLGENFDNPYARTARAPELDAQMDLLAKAQNTHEKIINAFNKRPVLDDLVESFKNSETPALTYNGTDVSYPSNNSFADKVEAGIKIMATNPGTQVVTMGTGQFGGWDDHSSAKDSYLDRSKELFSSLKAGMAHIYAEGKQDNISIVVLSDFGRNVNLNSSLGWDHGNLQNIYVLGGKNYFTHQGVVGATKLVDEGVINRLYLHPADYDAEYNFEPPSIAATLYKIFGITNPDILTEGNDPMPLIHV